MALLVFMLELRLVENTSLEACQMLLFVVLLLVAHTESQQESFHSLLLRLRSLLLVRPSSALASAASSFVGISPASAVAVSAFVVAAALVSRLLCTLPLSVPIMRVLGHLSASHGDFIWRWSIWVVEKSVESR